MTHCVDGDGILLDDSQRRRPAFLGADFLRYVTLLTKYVLVERWLLTISTVFGLLGLCLPFAYPAIIGALIDHVVIGHGPDTNIPLAAADRLS